MVQVRAPAPALAAAQAWVRALAGPSHSWPRRTELAAVLWLTRAPWLPATVLSLGLAGMLLLLHPLPLLPLLLSPVASPWLASGQRALLIYNCITMREGSTINL